MIFGKLIGGLLGLFAGGLFGAIIGLIAGHFFDRGIGQAMGFDFNADRERLQQLFFETSFTVMGHIAKADGRISSDEIGQAEALMSRLGMTAEQRRQAIDYFKRGAEPAFQLEPLIARFVSGGGRSHNLPPVLLEFLITIALADGVLHPAEKEILSRTAGYLGINAARFEQLLAMLSAQEHFRGGYQQSTGPASSASALADAYLALGVSASDDDKTIKRAYRKLMSEHHPDKLMSRGVPEEMIKMATEKSQEIQAAYELIKKSRG